MKNDFIKTDLPLPYHLIFEHQTYIKIDWPSSIIHNGKDFFKTGKVGTRRKDNTPSAEYAHNKGEIVWLNAVDGSVESD